MVLVFTWGLLGCIILPLLSGICPQILKMIIFKVRFEVRHIQCIRDPVFPRKVNLIESLIFLRSSKGPSTHGKGLDFLLEGNRSFLRCTQTRSPSLNKTCLRCLLAWLLYLLLAFSIWCWTFFWSSWISFTLSLASTFICSCCMGRRSRGPSGFWPYTTLKGDSSMVLLGALYKHTWHVQVKDSKPSSSSSLEPLVRSPRFGSPLRFGHPFEGGK